MTDLTGRITGTPSTVWHDEVLAPQFAYEIRHLLPWYIAIEKVLLLEYRRMDLLDEDAVTAIAARLHEITPESLSAVPEENLSDIAFAIERYVLRGLPEPAAAWHVDRSRNDLQACAQVLFARAEVLDTADELLRFARAAAEVAERTADLPMPGYTHLQAAQVITPGFYLCAVAGETVAALARLGTTYDELDRCPLGAGAMAGQELAFARERMAAQLGFQGVQPHALTAVASRGWALAVAADLATFGVTLSRFITDLMAWGSGEYRFIELPDELSGISSAMPQKKNYPVLERIRGRTAHLTAFWLDLAVGQRNTPYTNMVEVSKEAGTYLATLFATARSAVRLFTTVLANLRFHPERMRRACEREYLGGSTLANLLTLRAGVPWRIAQVIAGRYIANATDAGIPPNEPDPALLAAAALEYGHRLDNGLQLLRAAFTVDGALLAKQSSGATGPRAVRELLEAQRRDLDGLAARWSARRSTVAAARAEVDRCLGLVESRAF